MKKLLLLALLCLCLPTIALAQPKYAPYDMELSLRYRQLNHTEQALFDLMYDAIRMGETDVTLPKGTKYATMQMIHQVLIAEAPELCAVDPDWTIYFYQSKPDEATAIRLTYVLPVETQQSLIDQADAIARTYATGLGTFSAELMMHNYICQNVTYDLNAPHPYSAYGALLEGRAVCDGYAKAFMLLARRTGIPCSYLSGTALNTAGTEWCSHAWNIVELNGEPVIVDVTWDDQAGGTVYTYFNVPDAWVAEDHVAEDRGVLPVCTSAAWNWHVRNGGFVRAGQAQAALDEVMRGIAHSGTMADLRFEDAAEFVRVAGDFNAYWEDYNRRAAREDQVYGSLTWNTMGRQPCIIIVPKP